MHPGPALRLLPLVALALVVGGCGTATDTATTTSTSAPAASATVVTPSPSVAAKADMELVKASLVEKSWATGWPVTFDKAIKSQPITVCGGKAVPGSEEPKAVWRREWSSRGEGMGQTAYARSQIGGDKVIAGMESLDKACPSYTVNGSKIIKVKSTLTVPKLESWTTFISCSKTAGSGYRCYVAFGSPRMFGTAYAFANSQARAEDLLNPLIGEVANGMLAASKEA